MLCCRDCVSTGRVHHDDTAPRGSIYINVIDTSTRAADNPQPPRILEELRCDFCPAPHNQPFVFRDNVQQLPMRYLGFQIYFETIVEQNGHTSFINCIGNENSHDARYLSWNSFLNGLLNSWRTA